MSDLNRNWSRAVTSDLDRFKDIDSRLWVSEFGADRAQTLEIFNVDVALDAWSPQKASGSISSGLRCMLEGPIIQRLQIAKRVIAAQTPSKEPSALPAKKSPAEHSVLGSPEKKRTPATRTLHQTPKRSLSPDDLEDGEAAASSSAPKRKPAKQPKRNSREFSEIPLQLTDIEACVTSAVSRGLGKVTSTLGEISATVKKLSLPVDSGSVLGAVPPPPVSAPLRPEIAAQFDEVCDHEIPDASVAEREGFKWHLYFLMNRDHPFNGNVAIYNIVRRL